MSSKQERLAQLKERGKLLLKEAKSGGNASDSDEGDLSSSSISSVSSDMTDSDALSDISDISSVASIYLSPETKKGAKCPKSNKISKIPVRKEIIAQHPKVQQYKVASNVIDRPIAKVVPVNFLAPNLSDYSRATICIFEGADFPRCRIGERNTYVVARLHPDLEPINSPIAFNSTSHAMYNGGFDVEVIGLDFSSIVPAIEVYDFISNDQHELIGIGFIQLQMAKVVKDTCVVLQDEWVNIYTPTNRQKAGRVKVSLIFHNSESGLKVAQPLKSEEENKKAEAPQKEEAPIAKVTSAVQADVELLQPIITSISCGKRKVEEHEDDDNSFTLKDAFQPWKAGSWIPQKPADLDLVPQKQQIEPKIPPSPIEEKPANKASQVKFASECDLEQSDGEEAPQFASARPDPCILPKPAILPKQSEDPIPRPAPVSTKQRFARYADFNWN